MIHSRFIKIATALLFYTGIAVAEEIPKNLRAFTEQQLAAAGRHDTIVAAVQARNAAQAGSIQQRDAIWRSTPGIDAFMWDLMRNDCALILANLSQSYPFIAEAFVMDRQGALVCLTRKTSDYWQGDEAKFTRAYANGAGAIYYSEVGYDVSSDEIMVHISVPVMEDTRAIGAITFGISLDRWERR